MGSLRFSLREHDYHPSYSPIWVFSKEDGILRQSSYPNSSIGDGYVFIVVNRAWLNGKYLRWRWRGYGTWVVDYHSVLIYDGSYDRSSDTDFPTNSGIPTKGNGLLQTVITKTATFAEETQDHQVDVSGGSEEYCTIFFKLHDAYTGQNFWQQLYWFEINGGAGGSDNIFDEQFDDSVHMERTGTLGDYGYISDGDAVTFSVETDYATPITSTGGTLNGTLVVAGVPNSDERGFDWGTETGVYPNSWTESGSFGSGTFSHELTGLIEGTTSYFRAKAHNPDGWIYGDERSFFPTSLAVEFRFSNTDPPDEEPKRTIYTDVVNLPDPVKLSICVRVFNYDDVGLYMKVDAVCAGWTFTPTELGLLGTGANAYYLTKELGQRAKPASETEEVIAFTLEAYTDAGYTDLKWTFERSITMVFIKSDDGSWTLEEDDDFDDGTKMGWSAAGDGGYSSQFIVATDFVLSVPYSIRYYGDHTSSTADWYSRYEKSFVTPDKNQVFAIADIRHRHTNAINEAIEMQIDGVKQIYCGVETVDNKWMRVVFLLPRNTSVALKIGHRFRNYAYDQSYLWMDDFKIISKD